MSLQALRNSIRDYGQLTPVFLLGGVVVDGRRRKRCIQELGRTPIEIHLKSHKEAARVLWTAHPVQAWKEYGSDFETLKAAAEHFDVTPADVARIRGLLREPPPTDGPLGNWRARYRLRYESAQRYLSRVRQGLEPITLGGVENALKLPPSKG